MAGLSTRADAGMDRFAHLVTRVLQVPVAWVSVLEADQQILPGLAGGLGEPWASARSTPLTHALSWEVTQSGEPLVVGDTESDPRWRGHPAVTEMKVAAYAGMPVTDTDGRVLGSLCAIDIAPRVWSDADLADLADLVAACSAELRLRIVSLRADELAERTRGALGRSQLLLRAADDLARTIGLDEVRHRVRDLVTSDLTPRYVGLVLVENQRLRRLVDSEGDTGPDAGVEMERTYERYGLHDAWPTARAARDNTTIVVDGGESLAAGGYSAEARAAWDSLDLRTAICVPLPGADGPLGTLVIGWDTTHDIDLMERAVITALAGYTAHAVERARYVDNRITVARELQQAMLTDLPRVDGLDVAALYRPAATRDLVGGDWYDVYLLTREPAPHQCGEYDADGSPAARDTDAVAAVTIGDITGHDIHAATLMGQMRSMLRQADLDHPRAGPARAVSALERANQTLDIHASGTLVHGHLRPRPEQDGWELTWTNAGHPPPLLRHPDGTVESLTAGGIMLHPDLTPDQRGSVRTVLPAGSTLLLYTDGLVDQRDRSIDTALSATAALLNQHSTLPLPALLDTLADTIGGPQPDDDIALLAIRVPEPADRGSRNRR